MLPSMNDDEVRQMLRLAESDPEFGAQLEAVLDRCERAVQLLAQTAPLEPKAVADAWWADLRLMVETTALSRAAAND